MPRTPTGEALAYERADGGVTWYARFRAEGRRRRVRLGTDHEGWNETRAENAVAELVDQVRRGTWRPPPARTATAAASADPTFHEFASGWFAGKARGLAARTVEDYQWRLSNHLLPHFKDHCLSEIDVRAVDGYRAAKLAEREAARAAGLRGLSNDSVNATIALLAQILDVAAEHKLAVERPNPAKGRRRRLKTQRGRRSFLEPDQAAALLDAAGRLDAAGALSWEQVLEIRAASASNVALATRFGVSDSLVSRIRRGLVWRTPASAPARRALIATLLLAGPRVAELCALDVRDVDLPNRRLLIAGSKSDAARRQVVLSDLLLEELTVQLARCGPDGPLFPNTRGARYTPSGVRTAVLTPAAELAARTLPGLPAVTPHTLRRTFISLLLAGGADVPWVMAQVGHTDPKVTLQIYAQVIQSRQRDYGARVDRMIAGRGERDQERDQSAIPFLPRLAPDDPATTAITLVAGDPA
ncbi:tyrosine-type recombinase/integrase [Conexibacter sp. JD483]|uniref:tyrosine-type recombinase/integrase n=1 Tax=unclassified Conexibacter TaxID=2627773 RepID=UPI0027253833|nr:MULTISPECIES: site-specific integrase [unclassified Conexibacter]MDO8187234.1 tyrosine-type recombinase/integrase [Conexibacter sp. CPCC 205706]MDO8199331.1 tyrosine-type recombinase/integrase [Conexibacter sp. CPCC 205762]MDR9369268.1 tyrosine-type recombinase/integrase [Conexibacter sp. JD483]